MHNLCIQMCHLPLSWRSSLFSKNNIVHAKKLLATALDSLCFHDILYDQSVPEPAMRLFRAMTEALQHMAEQGIQLLCVTPLAPSESGSEVDL